MQACRFAPFVAFVRRWRGAPSAARPPGRGHHPPPLYAGETRFHRVDADEVTYPAHVILRYRLERDSSPDDELDYLPAAWNAGMKELLHRAARTARAGCRNPLI